MQGEPDGEIVATSIFRQLLSGIANVHAASSIGAFAGPPGLGKTTVARKFLADHPQDAVLVTPYISQTKSVNILQDVLTAIRRVSRSPLIHAPSNRRELQLDMQQAIEKWAWIVQRGVPRTRLTVIFDEAQNLSPEAIETLRYWNDASWNANAPLALVFLGNDQFRIEETKGSGPSFLSAAVRSRTSYRKTFGYKDLTDDDLTLIIESRGVVDPKAVALLLDHCGGSEINRDLRGLNHDLTNLTSAGEPVTATTVRKILGIR